MFLFVATSFRQIFTRVLTISLGKRRRYWAILVTNINSYVCVRASLIPRLTMIFSVCVLLLLWLPLIAHAGSRRTRIYFNSFLNTLSFRQQRKKKHFLVLNEFSKRACFRRYRVAAYRAATSLPKQIYSSFYIQLLKPRFCWGFVPGMDHGVARDRSMFSCQW